MFPSFLLRVEAPVAHCVMVSFVRLQTVFCTSRRTNKQTWTSTQQTQTPTHTRKKRKSEKPNRSMRTRRNNNTDSRTHRHSANRFSLQRRVRCHRDQWHARSEREWSTNSARRLWKGCVSLNGFSVMASIDIVLALLFASTCRCSRVNSRQRFRFAFSCRSWRRSKKSANNSSNNSNNRRSKRTQQTKPPTETKRRAKMSLTLSTPRTRTHTVIRNRTHTRVSTV